jgi:electron transfer flavoprotein alpha/beta subunit
VPGKLILAKVKKKKIISTSTADSTHLHSGEADEDPEKVVAATPTRKNKHKKVVRDRLGTSLLLLECIFRRV